jgi:hypothetical protein
MNGDNMALKDLVIKRRRKPQQSPANVIIRTLKNYGVSAPVATAAAITHNLRKEGYGFQYGPRNDE